MNPLEATESYEEWLRRHVAVDDDALERKHDKMRDSAGAFLRGAFYRWIQTWKKRVPDSIERAPVVLSIGDIHIENFGTWRDIAGTLSWGVNDFDECHALPCTHDLTRLATSLRLMLGDDLPGDFRDACRTLSGVYRETMALGRTAARPIQLTDENDYAWLHELAEEEIADSDAFWRKLTDPERATPVEQANLPRPAQLLLFSLLPTTGPPVDIGKLRYFSRVAGLGSLGRPRWLLLGASDIRQGVPKDPFAREAKALCPSAVLWARGEEGPFPPIETLTATAIRAPDPLLLLQNRWIGRRLAPDCVKVEMSRLHPSLLEKMIAAMGREIAHVHLAAPPPVAAQCAQYLAGLPQDWLADVSNHLAEKTHKDWEKFGGRERAQPDDIFAEGDRGAPLDFSVP